MSHNLTLGNFSDGVHGPANPIAVGQLIQPAHQNKFTEHGARVGNDIGPIPFNIPFTSSYGIRQSQKGGGKDSVEHGFCDSHGNWLGVVGRDQDAQAMVTHVQGKAASIPPGTPLYYRIKYMKPGDYVFEGNPG